MKVLLSLVVLFSSIGVFGQIKPTILNEIGTTNFNNLSYSAMIGPTFRKIPSTLGFYISPMVMSPVQGLDSTSI